MSDDSYCGPKRGISLRAGATNPVGEVALTVSDADAARVRADLSKEGLSRYVVLSPGGGWRSKCWPADRFGALCRQIHEQIGVPCVVNYGPGEESLVADVQATSGSAKPVAYDGELGTLSALLRDAQCIVGGDTGPLHLAIALGTPAVALFGPTDPRRNGPYPPGQTVLRSPTAVTTHDRLTATDPSLLELSVDEVFAAVKSGLELRVTVLDFFARWRVRLGYVLAVVVLWLARPTPRSILIGAGIGLIGIWIRAYAAGYLHKQEVLTVTGPYSRTRNPLYFGSGILTIGAAIAMNSWWVGGLLLVYFAIVYTFVMRREEMELRQKHGAAFDTYESSVPLFFSQTIGGN